MSGVDDGRAAFDAARTAKQADRETMPALKRGRLRFTATHDRGEAGRAARKELGAEAPAPADPLGDEPGGDAA